MKCKEIENGRSCPWEDCPDFNNDWCKNCPSYEDEDESDLLLQHRKTSDYVLTSSAAFSIITRIVK